MTASTPPTFGIRLRFMDPLYAAAIGNAMQLLHPESIDAKFLFGLFLLIVILEDFFLYYADVAPENTNAEGLSFLGMLSEIAVLACWFFAFQAFAVGSWAFVVFLVIFFGLKTLAGFVNCLVTRDLVSLKFGRELLFLGSVGVLTWIHVLDQHGEPEDSPTLLMTIAATWFVQTIAWWAVTAVYRAGELKQRAIASADATAPASGPPDSLRPLIGVAVTLAAIAALVMALSYKGGLAPVLPFAHG